MKQIRTQTIGWTVLVAGLLLGGTACKEANAKVKGVGDNLQAFIIQNCDNGDRYCQVCAFSGKPTIMAVGDLTDAGFEQDLKEIQGLVKTHKAKGLTAFALFGKFEQGRFQSFKDPKKAMEDVKKLQAKLGLQFPVTIVPENLTDKEKKNYTPFDRLYDVSQSRTVLVGAANNNIVFADTMKGEAPQYQALEAAVKKVL